MSLSPWNACRSCRTSRGHRVPPSGYTLALTLVAFSGFLCRRRFRMSVELGEVHVHVLIECICVRTHTCCICFYAVTPFQKKCRTSSSPHYSYYTHTHACTAFSKSSIVQMHCTCTCTYTYVVRQKKSTCKHVVLHVVHKSTKSSTETC